MKLSRIKLLCVLLLLSVNIQAQTLTKLTEENIAQAEFYLLDIKDHNSIVTPAVDAYIYNGETYIAISPLLEGLRVKYRLVDSTLTVTREQGDAQIELSPLSVTLDPNAQYWFNDGAFDFIPLAVLEQLFETKTDVSTSSLTVNFSGHTEDFPYKKIRINQRQRQANQFLTGDNQQLSNKQKTRSVITVPDRYRLATVPTGYLALDYRTNGDTDSFAGTLQSTSDLAYHSTLITLNADEEDVTSYVRLSRYPQYPGDKMLGFIDTYSFGDIWSRSAALSNNQSRGLGLSVSSNFIDGYHENFTTSFIKMGKPGWEADVFHNGRFIESRVVPEDGLMEFNNMEVFFGRNEFKIEMFGPFGEQETLIERVEVRRTKLAKGETSLNFGLLEYDSSLLEINAEEFDIDAVSANLQVGILDNWMFGLNTNISDIHAADGAKQTYNMINQVAIPNWFFENNLSITEQSIKQLSSLATSFFVSDSLIVKYASSWDDKNEIGKPDQSSLSTSYNFQGLGLTHNLSLLREERGQNEAQRYQYRIGFYGRLFNLSHSLSYGLLNDQESFTGNIGVSSRVAQNLRANISIPYDLKASETFNPDDISANLNYYIRTETSNHNLFLSNRSFFKENKWSVGYNLAFREPTHQFTLGAKYDADDRWSIRAGFVTNFGYDYYNDKLVFSRAPMNSGGTLDVHTYLDRRLNGIPDVLDYDLAGVNFYGGPGWENIQTNQQGKARLFGANRGITALTTNWQTGGRTMNQDYLIYNHPGSTQRINLPFYLTTELESFVLLNNGETMMALRGVPIIAKNRSTGDEYEIESDLDGYINFVNLLPGKYFVYIPESWLKENGYTTEYKGFSFEAPLQGGFVVLPEINLTRGVVPEANVYQLMPITLDESNFEPLIVSNNDKLIHLPPKGGVNVAHSFDDMNMAQFKRIRKMVTKEERQALRDKLKHAQNQQETTQLGVVKTQKEAVEKSEKENNYILYVGSFSTLQEANRASRAYAGNIKVVEGLDKAGRFIYRFEVNWFANYVDAERYAQEKFPTQSFSIEIPGEGLDLSSGWVVQYAATQELESVSELAQEFQQVEHLHVARKVVNGEYWYCLISRVFLDDVAATEFLKSAKEDGFIVEATRYLDTVWSK